MQLNAYDLNQNCARLLKLRGNFIIMVLSKRKKKLRAAFKARWNAALDKGKAILMCLAIMTSPEA